MTSLDEIILVRVDPNPMTVILIIKRAVWTQIHREDAMW